MKIRKNFLISCAVTLVLVVWGLDSNVRAQSSTTSQSPATSQASGNGSTRLDNYLKMYPMTNAERQAAADRAKAKGIVRPTTGTPTSPDAAPQPQQGQ